MAVIGDEEDRSPWLVDRRLKRPLSSSGSAHGPNGVPLSPLLHTTIELGVMNPLSALSSSAGSSRRPGDAKATGNVSKATSRGSSVTTQNPLRALDPSLDGDAKAANHLSNLSVYSRAGAGRKLKGPRGRSEGEDESDAQRERSQFGPSRVESRRSVL